MRRSLYLLLEAPNPKEGIARAVRLTLQAVIILNILAVIVESVDELKQAYSSYFYCFEAASVVLFTIEYLARLWASPESSGDGSSVQKRLRYLRSPYALIDLLAILPFYLSQTTIDLRFVRAFRLFRLVKLAKMARYWDALTMFARVFVRKRAELTASFLVFLVFLIVNSSCIYFAEKEVAGGAFTSIPAAMWWAVITMTTVGYGDMVPLTAIGKLFGAFTAVVGVALFAIFAGVMVSGFSEELEAKQATKNEQGK